MKKILILLLVIVTLKAGAQPGSTDSLASQFSKKNPVQLISHEPIPASSISKSGRKNFKKDTDFNAAQVDEVFARIWDETHLPRAFKPGSGISYQTKRSTMPYYKAYNLSDFSVMGYGFVLVWIPYEENQHMPDAFRPPSTKGFLFYTDKTKTTTNGKDEVGNVLPAAGKVQPDNTGTAATSGTGDIQVSKADMSQFLDRSDLGTMTLYYGAGGVASYAYIFDLRGRELKDKGLIADILAKKITNSYTFIGFEHRIGSCARAEGEIKKKAGTSIWVHCEGEYLIK